MSDHGFCRTGHGLDAGYSVGSDLLARPLGASAPLGWPGVASQATPNRAKDAPLGALRPCCSKSRSKTSDDHSSGLTKSGGEWVKDFVVNLAGHDPNRDLKLDLPLASSHC